MTTRLINESMSSRFTDLQMISVTEIQEKIAGSENIREAVGSKNLYHSLSTNPSSTVSEFQRQTFHLGDVSKLEYGSTHCYLKEMRTAVIELVEDESTPEEERALLNKWLQATDDALAITCNYDSFRIRVPSVMDSFLKGRNPLLFLPTRARLFSSLYLPGNNELEPICHYIVERIAALENGCYLTIPWGDFSHETLLVIERTNRDELRLSFIDPNTKRERRVFILEKNMSETNSLLNTFFWLGLLRSKFKKESSIPITIQFGNKTWVLVSAESGDNIPSELFMPVQKGNRCFAYGYWQLLRFLAIRSAPDNLMLAAELSKCVEMKIRKKILDLSPLKDTDLGKYAASEIERKSIKRALLRGPERVDTLFALVSKLFGNSKESRGQSLEKFLNQHRHIDFSTTLMESFVSGEQGNLSYKEQKQLFKIAKLIHLEAEKRLPFSELTEEEIELLYFIENEIALLENAKKMHYEKLLSLIKIAENHQPHRIITFLDRTSFRGYSLLYRLSKDTIVHTANIKGADLVDIFNKSIFVLRQQSSLEDIAIMANRLLAIASKQSGWWKFMPRHPMECFLESSEFQSHEGWEAIGNEIRSKMVECFREFS